MTCAHMVSVLPTASVKYLVRGKRLEAGCERPEVGGKRRKVKGKRDLRHSKWLTKVVVRVNGKC